MASVALRRPRHLTRATADGGRAPGRHSGPRAACRCGTRRKTQTATPGQTGASALREGELFALRWGDVDLVAATITVRRKRLRLASGEVIEDDPKSRAGRRTVALPAVLVAELERHRAVFGAADSDDYVFESAGGTPLERSNFRQRVWLPATRAVGLDGLRFHNLRHTAGTLAARTGATTKELMARLGHASPRASMIYQHASQDRDRRIAESLDAMAEEAGFRPPEPVTPHQLPARSGTDLARLPPSYGPPVTPYDLHVSSGRARDRSADLALFRRDWPDLGQGRDLGMNGKTAAQPFSGHLCVTVTTLEWPLFAAPSGTDLARTRRTMRPGGPRRLTCGNLAS
ncbi:MAG: site-specific integrase [Pseudonocardiaceae bacterium]